ncbi:MAG TPA: 2-dehydropantoate 2-reductase [Verrucomicrobiae bacterium]
MKIGVVGCGAVGSYYGAQLWRAGEDVHFLLRTDYDVVRRQGVRILTPKGDFLARPACAAQPETIGVCDLVLIALKTTANDQFPRLLPPLVGPQTAALTLQNGLGNEEALARLFPPEQVLGALCFVCLNRIAPGVIHHTDHGQIVLGEFQRPASPRTHGLAAVFRNAGVPCDVTQNLARAHWEKLVWNIPFNGLGIAGMAGYEALANPHSQLGDLNSTAPCLPTDRLLADRRWAGLLRELMDEVIAAANAMGLGVSAELADKMTALTETMGAYKASTLLDFEKGLPLELNSLFFEPLRLARQAGAHTPRLEALCNILCQLDARNRRQRAAASRTA